MALSTLVLYSVKMSTAERGEDDLLLEPETLVLGDSGWWCLRVYISAGGGEFSWSASSSSWHVKSSRSST